MFHIGLTQVFGKNSLADISHISSAGDIIEHGIGACELTDKVVRIRFKLDIPVLIV